MTTYLYASETCSRADGSAVAGSIPDSGWSQWEAGIGLFALGAEIRSGKIRKTNGPGSITTHQLISTGLPFDTYHYCWDLTRPADSLGSTRGGFAFRWNGVQWSGGGNDGAIVYWLRINAATVNLVYEVQKNGVVTGSGTILAGYAWAENTEQKLGVTVLADQVTVWTAVAGAGAVGTMTTRGSFTLPVGSVFNDSSHARYGAYGNGGPDAKWDNGRVFYTYLPTAPGVPSVSVLSGS